MQKKRVLKILQVSAFCLRTAIAQCMFVTTLIYSGCKNNTRRTQAVRVVFFIVQHIAVHNSIILKYIYLLSSETDLQYMMTEITFTDRQTSCTSLTDRETDNM